MAFIFTAEKPCLAPSRRRLADLVGPVAADPGIGPDPVAHPAAHHLPGGQSERPALQVPQGLLEPGQRRHQDRAAAVEAAAITDLPNVLDPERVVAEEAVAKRREGAVHRLRLAFQARLAPADRAFVRLDPDEQPARRDIEGLDLRDLHNPSSRRKPGPPFEYDLRSRLSPG